MPTQSETIRINVQTTGARESERQLRRADTATDRLSRTTKGLQLPLLGAGLLTGLFGGSLLGLASASGAGSNAIVRLQSSIVGLIDSLVAPFEPHLFKIFDKLDETVSQGLGLDSLFEGDWLDILIRFGLWLGIILGALTALAGGAVAAGRVLGFLSVRLDKLDDIVRGATLGLVNATIGTGRFARGLLTTGAVIGQVVSWFLRLLIVGFQIVRLILTLGTSIDDLRVSWRLLMQSFSPATIQMQAVRFAILSTRITSAIDKIDQFASKIPGLRVALRVLGRVGVAGLAYEFVKLALRIDDAVSAFTNMILDLVTGEATWTETWQKMENTIQQWAENVVGWIKTVIGWLNLIPGVNLSTESSHSGFRIQAPQGQARLGRVNTPPVGTYSSPVIINMQVTDADTAAAVMLRASQDPDFARQLANNLAGAG